MFAALLCVCGFAPMLWSQAAQTSVEAYAVAIKQPRVLDQISGLERYLTIAENGILKEDALEVLVWDYMRMGSLEHMSQRAGDLMKLDPGNPLAIAALGFQAAGPEKRKSSEYRAHVAAVTAALVALERLGKPEGMLEGDFAALRRRVESRLNGMLGLAYVDRKEYRQARTPLQQAVAVDPGNPQYAYALGLSLLYGREPDPQNAFLYLARAVDLTQGTAAGPSIAEFARKQYHKAGGSDADWNRFLAVAVVPGYGRSQPTVSAGTAKAPAPGFTARGTPAAASGGRPAGPVPVPSSASRGNPTLSKAPGTAPPGAETGAKASPSNPQTTVAAAGPEAPSRPTVPRPERKPQVIAPNPPVSLGILIETALLTGKNRPAIIAALRDVVRHLRPDDEAAILVFSDQLDFEQDLTANDQLLEQAMNGLRPRRGRALLDGIAFAAGHLKRIGKNSNRVLLVVSDGRSIDFKSDAGPLSSQVSGVRIDCIGLNADGADQRNLLERLAYYSGGRASFARGPEEFRTVALQMTQHLGLP
ncbi:MAG TPA: VWA domain-containing protein [Candidatus Limnocylindrales bacterium]|nr:VWA domain-containing protein [Candidatus Limnocylindrales bacterium]